MAKQRRYQKNDIQISLFFSLCLFYRERTLSILLLLLLLLSCCCYSRFSSLSFRMYKAKHTITLINFLIINYYSFHGIYYKYHFKYKSKRIVFLSLYFIKIVQIALFNAENTNAYILTLTIVVTKSLTSVSNDIKF